MPAKAVLVPWIMPPFAQRVGRGFPRDDMVPSAAESSRENDLYPVFFSILINSCSLPGVKKREQEMGSYILKSAGSPRQQIFHYQTSSSIIVSSTLI